VKEWDGMMGGTLDSKRLTALTKETYTMQSDVKSRLPFDAPGTLDDERIEIVSLHSISGETRESHS
jgi:hypothetical protein